MTVFTPLVGMLWRTIESYGVDPRKVIGEGIYRPGRAAPMGARIGVEAYMEVVIKAARLIDDPAIGLRAGEHLHPSHLGALGHAWMASSSLKTAIERGQRFSRMYDESIQDVVTEERGVLKVEYRVRHHGPLPDVVADAHLAGLLAMCRLNFGRSLRPAFVRMRRSPPLEPRIWHDWFGVEVQFDQAEDCLAITAADATKPLTGSSPMLVALHEDVIKRQIAELDRSNIVNRALAVILEQLPSGGVSEVSVAKALNMTTRTLHRKLGEKGVSFRSLLANARKELVRRYIDEPAYSLTEIAFLLGYNSASAFSRAFKRWHGVSPTQARSAGDGNAP